MSEKKVPKPTWLNLYALGKCIEEAPGGVIGRVAPTDAPHLQRCINAGLLESAGTRGTWKLSAAGIEALKPRSPLAARVAGLPERDPVRREQEHQMTHDVNSPMPSASAWIADGPDQRPRVARTGQAAAVVAAPSLPFAVGNDTRAPR
jgi:hypothetical protein